MQIKEKVLAELLRAGGEFCSGGEIAKQLGCSRTAVWKAIDQLKSEGCEIQAVTNRGYRLCNVADVFDEAKFQVLVKGCRLRWNVVHLKETDSTNNEAKRIAANYNSETIVLADRQTAGKGRLGKQFHSPSGGLYMSLVLKPEMPIADMMAVTACTAAAVHGALEEYGIPSQIKWVNDLFLNGRKICGILTEGSFSAELLQMEYLVIGIGINLRPDPALPAELKSIITDLQSETGTQISRTELAASVVRHLERYLDGIGERTFLPVYTEHSCTLGHHVRVKAERGECIALAVGFAEDAGLIVEHPDGSKETIRTGTALIVD